MFCGFEPNMKIITNILIAKGREKSPKLSILNDSLPAEFRTDNPANTCHVSGPQRI
jgi:hypothetical protein